MTRCPLGCTRCCFNQAPVLGQQRDPDRGRYSRDANKTVLNSVCNSFPLLTSSPPLHSPLPHIPKSWANILSCFSHSKALTQESSCKELHVTRKCVAHMCPLLGHSIARALTAVCGRPLCLSSKLTQPKGNHDEMTRDS